jgi:hypothetical protein
MFCRQVLKGENPAEVKWGAINGTFERFQGWNFAKMSVDIFGFWYQKLHQSILSDESLKLQLSPNGINQIPLTSPL